LSDGSLITICVSIGGNNENVVNHFAVLLVVLVVAIGLRYHLWTAGWRPPIRGGVGAFGDQTYYCSGTLISPTVFLTAAL
jgi:hypothetical protein